MKCLHPNERVVQNFPEKLAEEKLQLRGIDSESVLRPGQNRNQILHKIRSHLKVPAIKFDFRTAAEVFKSLKMAAPNSRSNVRISYSKPEKNIYSSYTCLHVLNNKI